MCIVFVRGIHEHETCGALKVIGSEHTNVETRNGFPDEHDGSPAIRLIEGLRGAA
jgi:hypothetical protein